MRENNTVLLSIFAGICGITLGIRIATRTPRPAYARIVHVHRIDAVWTCRSVLQAPRVIMQPGVIGSANVSIPKMVWKGTLYSDEDGTGTTILCKKIHTTASNQRLDFQTYFVVTLMDERGTVYEVRPDSYEGYLHFSSLPQWTGGLTDDGKILQLREDATETTP